MIPLFIIITAMAGLLFKRANIQRESVADSKREMAKAHFDKGMSFYNDSSFALAIKELEQAIKSDSTYSLAWSNLAAFNIHLNNLGPAIIQTIKAIEFDPQNSVAAYNLAYALQEKERFTEAIEWYMKAVEMDSTFTRAYSALSSVYNRLNRPVDAILILNKAKRITPESRFNFLIYKNLGRAYYILNEHNEALKFLLLSRNLNPTWPETICWLAEVYETAGKTTESIKQWQYYIEVESDTLKRNEAIIHLQKIKK